MEIALDVVSQVSEQRERVRASLSRIKHKVAVMSGKGGVGKSVVTANLALALADKGFSVGILDADVDGPSIPRMLGVGQQRLGIEAGRVIPPAAIFNIKVASVALLLSDEETAVTWGGPNQSAFAWRGAMEMSTIREFLADVQWGDRDLMLIDLPPGTAGLHSLVDLVPELAGAIVVTIPSRVAQATVKRSIDFARKLGVPLIGLVKNMDGFLCPQCTTPIDLFPSGDAREIVADYGLPFVTSVPFDPSLARCSDRGSPYLLLFGDSPAAEAFRSIAGRIADFLERPSSPGP